MGAWVLTTLMLLQGRFHVDYLVLMHDYRTPNVQQGYPIPPSEYLGSWKLARGFTHNRTCHLSQGVRHRAEGCVAPGWLLARSVDLEYNAIKSVETLPTTRRCMSEGRALHNQQCENLKPYNDEILRRG
jgi:hypothetical protein